MTIIVYPLKTEKDEKDYEKISQQLLEKITKLKNSKLYKEIQELKKTVQKNFDCKNIEKHDLMSLSSLMKQNLQNHQTIEHSTDIVRLYFEDPECLFPQVFDILQDYAQGKSFCKKITPKNWLGIMALCGRLQISPKCIEIIRNEGSYGGFDAKIFKQLHFYPEIGELVPFARLKGLVNKELPGYLLDETLLLGDKLDLVRGFFTGGWLNFSNSTLFIQYLHKEAKGKKEYEVIYEEVMVSLSKNYHPSFINDIKHWVSSTSLADNKNYRIAFLKCLVIHWQELLNDWEKIFLKISPKQFEEFISVTEKDSGTRKAIFHQYLYGFSGLALQKNKQGDVPIAAGKWESEYKALFLKQQVKLNFLRAIKPDMFLGVAGKYSLVKTSMEYKLSMIVYIITQNSKKYFMYQEFLKQIGMESCIDGIKLILHPEKNQKITLDPLEDKEKIISKFVLFLHKYGIFKKSHNEFFDLLTYIEPRYSLDMLKKSAELGNQTLKKICMENIVEMFYIQDFSKANQGDAFDISYLPKNDFGDLLRLFRKKHKENFMSEYHSETVLNEIFEGNLFRTVEKYITTNGIKGDHLYELVDFNKVNRKIKEICVKKGILKINEIKHSEYNEGFHKYTSNRNDIGDIRFVVTCDYYRVFPEIIHLKIHNEKNEFVRYINAELVDEKKYALDHPIFLFRGYSLYSSMGLLNLTTLNRLNIKERLGKKNESKRDMRKIGRRSFFKLFSK